MRLFSALLRKRMPNGHIYRGKDRLVKPVSKTDFCNLKREFEVEEKNMFYLRHSFLSLEESHGHALALGLAEAKLKVLINEEKKFFDNVTIETRLGHLRYKEGWE